MTKRELAKLVQETLAQQEKYFHAPAGSFEKQLARRASQKIELKLRAAALEVLAEAEPDLFSSLPEDE